LKKEDKEYEKLCEGFEAAMFIQNAYEKEFGEPKSWWYTWIGWNLLGGKTKNEIHRAFILGWILGWGAGIGEGIKEQKRFKLYKAMEKVMEKKYRKVVFK